MTLVEIMQNVLDMSDVEREDLASRSLRIVYDELDKCGVTSDLAADFILNTIRLFISADRKCSMAEYQFIKKLYDLKMSYDDFFDLTNHGADLQFVKEFDELIDSFTVEGKNSLCMFGLCILACDGTITVEEQKLFDRILD